MANEEGRNKNASETSKIDLLHQTSLGDPFTLLREFCMSKINYFKQQFYKERVRLVPILKQNFI